MNFIAKLLVGLSLVVTLSSCGNVSVNETTTGTGQATNLSNFDAETAYLNMPAPDYNVVFNPFPFGGSSTQRQTTDRFCRKSSATVPNPTYSYRCWALTSSGASAESTYNQLKAFRHRGVFFGMFGSGIMEASSVDESIICSESTPTVPNAIASYACYTEL
jgi:hypothetical protein